MPSVRCSPRRPSCPARHGRVLADNDAAFDFGTVGLGVLGLLEGDHRGRPETEGFLDQFRPFLASDTDLQRIVGREQHARKSRIVVPLFGDEREIAAQDLANLAGRVRSRNIEITGEANHADHPSLGPAGNRATFAMPGIWPRDARVRPLKIADQRFWPGLEAGDPTVIVFNDTTVTSNPAAGPSTVRRTLLTDETVEGMAAWSGAASSPPRSNKT
jgi:hypothetical protein